MPTKKMTNELKSIKKRAINLTDKNAPEITDWKKAVTGKFYRPVKKQITVRIDADVLAWFRLTAEKYQTLINTACREYMTHHKVSRKKTKQKRASF
ncbi:MAG TPA: BrnA antitoxin family protein [Gammaproteobacteria bacterium]|nr:BrnA antitoxin family protein [Gammaproteobacteria bacterium]